MGGNPAVDQDQDQVQVRVEVFTERYKVQAIRMAEALAAESPVYSKLDFSPYRTSAHLDRYLENDVEGGIAVQRRAWVATADGALLGCLGGVVGRKPGFNELIASDETLVVDPRYRGANISALLVDEYVRWAKGLGVKIINMGSTVGIVDVDKARAFYALLGFDVTGFLATYRE